MKHLKKFNEGVIKPYDFDTILDEVLKAKDLTVDKMNIMFEEYGVQFVDVDYFKSKLKTKKEIELVPEKMRPLFGGVKFAAHNIYTDKMYVCVDKSEFIKSINGSSKKQLSSFLREILRHESIHKQQGQKRDIVIRNLENSPMDPKSYFGSTDETMAYAQSFIDQCHQRGMKDEDILAQIRGGKPSVSWIENVYKDMDPKVKFRFRKYVYQYLTKSNESLEKQSIDTKDIYELFDEMVDEYRNISIQIGEYFRSKHYLLKDLMDPNFDEEKKESEMISNHLKSKKPFTATIQIDNKQENKLNESLRVLNFINENKGKFEYFGYKLVNLYISKSESLVYLEFASLSFPENKKLESFSMQNNLCDRCHKPTGGVTTMSIFNTDVICIPCKDEERKDPEYKAASEAEREEVRKGNMNYGGPMPDYKPLKNP